MTAVAGDFYEFIPVDGKRVGFLVADVTGHGVPAALIASMIKVAMQSVVACAHEPREVLRGLNRILYGLLRDQLVSAAYLWLDTGNRTALYSAAGHPPLLLWREGKLEGIGGAAGRHHTHRHRRGLVMANASGTRRQKTDLGVARIGYPADLTGLIEAARLKAAFAVYRY